MLLQRIVIAALFSMFQIIQSLACRFAALPLRVKRPIHRGNRREHRTPHLHPYLQSELFAKRPNQGEILHAERIQPKEMRSLLRNTIQQ